MFCEEKQHPMKNFLEVCLLLGLAKNEEHGYGLCEALEAFGYQQQTINSSSIYRILREMDKKQLVVSHWEKGEKGPQKRVYRITEKGRKELDDRAVLIQERKKRIESFLEVYDIYKKGE